MTPSHIVYSRHYRTSCICNVAREEQNPSEDHALSSMITWPSADRTTQSDVCEDAYQLPMRTWPGADISHQVQVYVNEDACLFPTISALDVDDQITQVV